MYNEKLNFILAVDNLEYVEELQNYGFKYYWNFPITSYFELDTIKNYKPCYLLLGIPLCFDLINIKQNYNIPIRLVPNIAYESYLPHKNGINGQWIRPEDVSIYEPYVDVLEFRDVDLAQERTLLHIYKDNQQWPGNLNLLIKKLNYNIDNRAISSELAKRRLSCGQKCVNPKYHCTACPSEFHLVTAIDTNKNDLIKKSHNN